MDNPGSKHILLIEDSNSLRKLLSIRLGKQGYEVSTAEDGLEGLEKVRMKKPDLIILDLLLPGMDGHKVCRLIKLNSLTRDTPIVMYTSRDLDEDAELAKQCGADAFIVKTTRSAIMLDVIRQLLNKNQRLSEERLELTTSINQKKFHEERV